MSTCTCNTEQILSLEEYAKVVEQLAYNKENNIINNEGNEHALIIFENIFKHSLKKIRIAAGSLCENDNKLSCNYKYINSLELFLKRDNAVLEILLLNQDINDSQIQNNFFYKKLASFKSSNNKIIVKHTNDHFFVKGNGSDTPIDVHFCVGDDHMYRFEEDIAKRKAMCNFNDPKISKKLSDVFDSVFNSENSRIIFF